MARESQAFSYKGMLNLSAGVIIESGKEEDKIFDFMKVLQAWNGQEISLSIKLDTEPEQVSTESEESDVEADW